MYLGLCLHISLLRKLVGAGIRCTSLGITMLIRSLKRGLMDDAMRHDATAKHCVVRPGIIVLDRPIRMAGAHRPKVKPLRLKPRENRFYAGVDRPLKLGGKRDFSLRSE